MSSSQSPAALDPSTNKPIHTILLDSSPLLLNSPGISTLLANGHVLVTTPSVLSEIKNEEAKSRVETLYKPFLELRSPKPDSLAFVKAFARKTGDASVLSQTDFEVLALAYDLECERNGGDWRLRNAPGQKRLNGSPPDKIDAEGSVAKHDLVEDQTADLEETENVAKKVADSEVTEDLVKDIESVTISQEAEDPEKPQQTPDKDQGEDTLEQSDVPVKEENVGEQQIPQLVEDQDSADSDDGWITPSNIKRRKAQDEAAASKAAKARGVMKTLQVATMTGDFAMQNVLLQINLNLLSTKTCQRISQIKQFVLRCHACFTICKDMSKQFCPRCGKPSLTRVTCTTNDKGEVKLHLKANMQWNNRGNVYSIPKPTPGSSNQRWKGPAQGGGKGGWGNDLILAEDQKEYLRAMSSAKRAKARDLMDEDTLPNILTGQRDRTGGRPKVGAGRNVNSRKR